MATVNVDENPLTAAGHEIEAIPTVAVYRGGKIVKMLSGAIPLPLLEDELAEVL